MIFNCFHLKGRSPYRNLGQNKYRGRPGPQRDPGRRETEPRPRRSDGRGEGRGDGRSPGYGFGFARAPAGRGSYARISPLRFIPAKIR